MDFYVILGLGPGASPAEIKRAYRRLSRRYHPGLNPGDRAAGALFRRISEAYDTLSHPDRRRTYDAGGASAQRAEGGAFEFSGFDFSVAVNGSAAATFSELFAEALHPPAAAHDQAQSGADLHATVVLSFEEAMRGVGRTVVVMRHVPCASCDGAGQVRTPEGRCAHCQATGKVRWARGHMVFSKSCTACAGTGRQRFQRCATCTGHGRAVRSEGVTVPVPAGVPDGARLIIHDKGHAGRGGGRTGDLYVDVRVEAHPVFRRDGQDLFIIMPIAVHEAVLGARVEVPSLDGPLHLRVPPGTQAGHQFRLSGRGVPNGAGGRGDLVVEVRLVLPQTIDERSKDLMREFGKLNSADVRRDLHA